MIQLRLLRPEERVLKCSGKPSPYSTARCEVPVQAHWNICPRQDIHAGRTRAGYWKIWPVSDSV